MASAAKSSLGLNALEDSNCVWDTFQLLQGQVHELVKRGAFAGRPSSTSPTGAHIQDLLRARRMRAKFFKEELFADPAWDMLLDLYRAHLDQHRVSVSSACLASGVPNTTALRWLIALEQEDLVTRRPDPLDGRRVFVGLTSKAIQAMESYIASIGDTRPV